MSYCNQRVFQISSASAEAEHFVASPADCETTTPGSIRADLMARTTRLSSFSLLLLASRRQTTATPLREYALQGRPLNEWNDDSNDADRS
jgi:hypothetical protein